MEGKTHSIPETFIKEAYAAACGTWQYKIKALVPEAFINRVKPGDWVKMLDGYGTMKKGDIVKCKEYQSGNDGDYMVMHHTLIQNCSNPGLMGDFLAPHMETMVLASRSEITDALLGEAIARGYVVNTYVETPGGELGHLKSDKSGYHYFPNQDYMTFDGWIIYQNSEWMKIVNVISLAEAEEKLELKIIV